MSVIQICNDFKSAHQRNQALLKSLEVAKARLRSRVTYSPVMTQLAKLKKVYADKLIEQQQTVTSDTVKVINGNAKIGDGGQGSSQQQHLSADTTTPTRLKKIYGPTFI